MLRGFGIAVLRHIVASIALIGLLSACQRTPDLNVIDLASDIPPPTSADPARTGAIQKAFLAPAGNFTMVTVRTRPNNPVGDPVILCSTPSPDWATAYATAQQFQASGGASGGPSGSLSASGSSSEAITAMLGRSAGVVALRDGLYKACEAYANGVIGKDAYALILSQYGNLLVALAGSGGGAGASSTPAATPSGVAVAVSTGGATSAAPAPAKDNTPPAGGTNTQVALLQQQALQALLVACISDGDKTVKPSDRNSLLGSQTVCPALLTSVVAQVPGLLGGKPMTPAGKPPPAKKKVVAHPPVASPARPPNP